MPLSDFWGVRALFLSSAEFELSAEFTGYHKVATNARQGALTVVVRIFGQQYLILKRMKLLTFPLMIRGRFLRDQSLDFKINKVLPVKVCLSLSHQSLSQSFSQN